MKESSKEVKRKFLEDNPDLTAVSSTKETPSYGDFFNISEEDEVWILQCPKGTSVEKLQSQNLKLPGRCNSSANGMEALAVEFTQPKQEVIGYTNVKGRHAIKILPVKGSIILRNRLKANNALTIEEIAEESENLGRVLFPDDLKQRHPLHGFDYKDKIEISQEVEKRLKHAEKMSANARRKPRYPALSLETKPLIDVITIEDDEELHTIDSKKSERKRKHTNQHIESGADHHRLHAQKIKAPKMFSEDDQVCDDLKWIQAL